MHDGSWFVDIFSYDDEILSQVFYYLGELNDSLSYALGAGAFFDVSEDTDYVHTLLGDDFDSLFLCLLFFCFLLC